MQISSILISKVFPNFIFRSKKTIFHDLHDHILDPSIESDTTCIQEEMAKGGFLTPKAIANRIKVGIRKDLSAFYAHSLLDFAGQNIH